MLGGRADAQAGLLALGAQHHRGGAVAEQRRGNHVGLGAAVGAEGQRAQLDHHHENDLARLGARKPGADRQARDAAGAAEPEHRHARCRRLKAHFRADARFQAGRRDAGGGYRHDHIDVARRDAGAVERGLRGLHEQRAGAVEIGLRALGPVVRRIEPFDRAHRIAPLDAGVDEYVGELRITGKGFGVDAAREIGDRRLFKLMRRHCRRQRQQRHRR